MTIYISRQYITSETKSLTYCTLYHACRKHSSALYTNKITNDVFVLLFIYELFKKKNDLIIIFIILFCIVVMSSKYEITDYTDFENRNIPILFI